MFSSRAASVLKRGSSSSELQRSRAPAPWLGQHSADILQGLGFGKEQIATLFADGVVYDRYREKATA